MAGRGREERRAARAGGEAKSEKSAPVQSSWCSADRRSKLKSPAISTAGGPLRSCRAGEGGESEGWRWRSAARRVRLLVALLQQSQPTQQRAQLAEALRRLLRPRLEVDRGDVQSRRRVGRIERTRGRRSARASATRSAFGWKAAVMLPELLPCRADSSQAERQRPICRSESSSPTGRGVAACRRQSRQSPRRQRHLKEKAPGKLPTRTGLSFFFRLGGRFTRVAPFRYNVCLPTRKSRRRGAGNAGSRCSAVHPGLTAGSRS